MINCKWEYIEYSRNNCDCDECIDKMCNEAEEEMLHLEWYYDNDV